jgi:hypothetical protein
METKEKAEYQTQHRKKAATSIKIMRQIKHSSTNLSLYEGKKHLSII